MSVTASVSRSHPDERSVPKNRQKIRPQGNHDSSPAFFALNGLLSEARRHSALSALVDYTFYKSDDMHKRYVIERGFYM